jgi:hypothetical protein
MVKLKHGKFVRLAWVVATFATAFAVSPAPAEDALHALQNPGAAPSAPAQRTMSGEWSGRYICRQGVTGVQVVLSDDGSRALFHFYGLPENPGVPEGCFSMSGSFDPASGALNLTAGKWIVRPHNFMTADVSGNLDASGQVFAGRILGPAGCSNIVLARTPSPRPLPNACERGLP